MGSLNWAEIFFVFISCAIKPGLAGIPQAVIYGFSFPKALLVCGAGGFTGIIVFTFLISEIIFLFNKFLDKYFPYRNKNRKVFTKRNRFIIKAKRNFGIIGVSAITPVILSFPLGIFLSLRFFGDRKKTIVWMTIFMLAWTIVLYFIVTFFRDLFI